MERRAMLLSYWKRCTDLPRGTNLSCFTPYKHQIPTIAAHSKLANLTGYSWIKKASAFAFLEDRVQHYGS